MSNKESTKDWVSIIKDWSTSKLSQKEFCRRNSLKYSSFKNQKYKHIPKNEKMLKIEVSQPIQPKINNSFLLELPSRSKLIFPAGLSNKSLKMLLLELGLL